jgi:iron complex outermembrane receptor protein
MRKIGLILLILSTATLSFAQDTIKESSIPSIEVVGIRASSKTPVTQKKITAQEISKSYQGQEMTYILSNTPSVNFSSDGGHAQGYTYFRMRGIDQTRINMTLNGVPLNEPEDQGVYFSNYPMFATNIQSMQIQRGVGTSSNGTSSYGGSINFESKNGLDTSTNVEAGVGSFNTTRFNFNHSTGLCKNGFSLYSGLAAYNSDGYRYNSGGYGYSAFLSGAINKKRNTLKFTGFHGLSANNMAWYAVSESDIKLDPRTNYNPKGEKDNFKQSFIQIQNIKKLGLHSSLTSTAYYNRLDGNWGMYADSANLMVFGLGSNFYGLINNYSLNTNRFTLNAGAIVNNYNRDHNMHFNNEVNNKVYSNTGFKREISGYIKTSYDIKKFTIYADAQLRNVNFKYSGDTYMNDLNWTFFNPKGGVNFRQNKNTSYYVSVGQTHREPTRTDMFGGWDNLSTLNIITPEKVTDYELGSYINFNKIAIQYNLFYMDFKNEITLLGALGANGLPLMTNVTKSYRSGLEVDITYKISKAFTLVNNSSFMNCKIINNGNETRPLYTPKVIINQSVNFEHKGFIASLSAKYHSKSFIDFENTSTTSQFVLLNCNVGYQFHKFTALVHLNNITNQKYFTNGYVIAGEKYFFANAPFNFGFTLKAKF